ncbi:FHA domain-containing protein [Longimicrobium sp.]|uniref:FHA domain-containing protein n=1 Tax=Longimicrobium sp. TaxID=2029185 RepID=UPI002B5B6A44|nr:FHA domain-containing protein [Longimicrobium sp.]HSU13907.1 FHA domain-containing protein [Longimicrobium sp.]
MATNLPQAGPLATFGVAAGPRYGEQIPVPAPVVTVGRGAGADVVIDDDSVSVQHARLEFDLGAWRITDLDSTNGTAIEGVKLAPNVPTPLPYGAAVRFGGVKLQFREVESADLAAARAAYVPPAKEVTLKEERRGFRFPLWLALLVVILLALLAYAIVQMNQPAPVPRQLPAPTDVPAARAGRP